MKKEADGGRCDVCVQGKLSRKPFPAASQSRASKPLELVHTDLMGKFNPPSNGGAQYAIVFTDDYSRYVTVMTMKDKDETVEKLSKYKTMIESLSGEKLKKIRSDFGGEYVNEELDKYFAQNGIVHEKSVPYCKQQYGRGERQNRTVGEMTRCMLAESGADKKMWAEAMNTAAYNRNRTPSRAVGFQIPIELMTKRPMSLEDYEHMRPFGCRVQAMREVRTKLDTKAIECVLLGYEESTKDGYRLLNLETKKVIIRRDVVFHETEFPWKTSQSTPTNNSRYYPEVLEFNSEDEESEEEQEEEFNRRDGEENQRQEDPEILEIPVLPEDQPEPVEEIEPPVLRRSCRDRRRKKCYCEDEGCGNSCKVCTALPAFQCEELEPSNVAEAKASPSRNNWKAAMDEELKKLRDFNTWDLVPRPKNKTILGCTWKFKIKTDSSGNPVKYKARLVGQGFAQKYGIDYHETYSPVVKRKTIRLMLALGVEEGWKCEHVDVISAYINSDINEEIYIEQPEEFESSKQRSTVCRLKKCLYGLKQSGMEWYKKIKGILISMGLRPSHADPCLFINQEMEIYVGLYVDDLAIWARKQEDLDKFKRDLNSQVEVRELGEISDFLSLRIQKFNDQCISIDQTVYIEKILDEFGLSEAKGTHNPVSGNLFNQSLEEDGDANQETYRRAIGMLLYVANGTRPDISFAVSYLSQFLSAPKRKHEAAVRHLMRYLKHTRDYCLVYRKTGNQIKVFSDADFANNKSDRKSFSGLVILLASGPIEWRCKKQTVVATSTKHAEYIAMAVATQECLWLKNVLLDLGFSNKYDQPCIFADNVSALSLAEKDEVDDRSKAIDIKYHFIKDCIKKRLVRVQYVTSRDNLADLLTKSLTGRKTQELSVKIGLTIP